jgi:hypothetical protein
MDNTDLTDTSIFCDAKSIDYRLEETEQLNTTEHHSKGMNKTRKCPTPPQSTTKLQSPTVCHDSHAYKHKMQKLLNFFVKVIKQKASRQPTLLSLWKLDIRSVNSPFQQKSKEVKRKQKTLSNEEVGHSQRKKQKLQ